MRRYIYVAVFFSGITSLALEMAASRLLGNVFGTSNLVWASIIGLILIYLTLGYFIGGRWADRSPYPKTFYSILAWAALSVGLVPMISRPVLKLSANAFDNLQIGILVGSFASVMILFIIPVTLLGMTSPFAIRLAISNSQEAGKISGKIYAISTLGSFIGTFLPVLVLIPIIGTYRTFLSFSALLLVIALIGLFITQKWRGLLPYLWMPVVLAILAIFGTNGPSKSSAGQIFETESAYNYIQVLESNGYFMLRLNDGQGVHSIYNPKQQNYYGPWEQVLVSPFFNPAPYTLSNIKRMAIVGLAAGTTARQATQVFGPIPIDGYEIDPKIIEVGQKYFGMTEPNLNSIVQDGRWGLEHSQFKYQIISIDAYRPPYIPPHLTTQEFFRIVRQHLTDDGVMVINVGRSPEDRDLINDLSTTIKTIFPSIHVMDIPGTFNSIIFATVKPSTNDNFQANFNYLLQQQSIDPLLLESMQLTLANLQPDPPTTRVYTDDLSPIELVTNHMVLNYLITGEVKDLK